MSIVYISGHLNPDMDSICAAYAYADLKNKIDKLNTYIPIRCGRLNKSTKRQFNALNLEPPTFLSDIKARVKDIMITSYKKLESKSPIYDLIAAFSDPRISAVPILDRGNFKALLTIDDITNYFLREGQKTRSKYHILTSNLSKVIDGRFLLKQLRKNIKAPILVGSMHYDLYVKRCKALSTLPILVTGKRERHIKYAIENNFPLIIVTGLEKDEELNIDYKDFKGDIYISNLDTAETIRLLRLCEKVIFLEKNNNEVKLDKDVLFDEARSIFRKSSRRAISVYDEDEWVGFLSSSCFLERPAQKLILVDHNEVDQGILGADEAEIVEIIDHHRFNPKKTNKAIFIACEPLGSTCSIIYNLYRRYDINITKDIAKVLLSGITSDTVILKSPTTTFLDINIVDELCKIANIDDYSSWAEKIFANDESLAERDMDEVIGSDFKIYKERGINFGVGQVEVTQLKDVEYVFDRILEKLIEYKDKKNLDWAMLLITDVIRQNSFLVTTSFDKTYHFSYDKTQDNLYYLPKIISRKKQVLPEVIRILEED